MIGGHVGKILRVNLTTKEISTIDTEQYEDWYGGLGMGSAIFWDLCEDKTITDGFDPRNVLVLAGSPLAGTLTPGAGRMEVTGIGTFAYPIPWFTRGNIGGRFQGELKAAGWDGIAIEGKADKPVWINIINDQVTIEDAEGVWGLDAWKAQEEIYRRVTGSHNFGKWGSVSGDKYTTQKPAVLCISQAGENLSRWAILLHGAGNAVGYGGFGGVFGSKNLKAISTLGTGSVSVADPQALLEARLWLTNNYGWNVDDPHIKEIPPVFLYETAVLTGPPGRTALGTDRTQPNRPAGCQGCFAPCKRRTVSTQSNETICSESLWASGQTPAETQRITDLCQTYGLCAGYELGQCSYLYNLYNMGILGPGKQIECDLPFNKYGTYEFFEMYVKAIAYREGIGDDIAEGYARAAEKWGRYKEDTDSGLLAKPNWGYGAHYEPRCEVEWGYGSILGDRDINEHCFNTDVHWRPLVEGWAGEEHRVSAERLVEIFSTKTLPYTGDVFMWDYSENEDTGIYSDHRAKEIAWHRHFTRFWKESIGFCDHLWPKFVNTNRDDFIGYSPEAEPKFLNAVTGGNLGFADGVEIGRKIWNLNKAIWVLQGRHRDMEKFTGYIYNVPLAAPDAVPVYENGKWSYSDCLGRTLNEAKFEEFKTKFYEFEGWDPNTGWPKRSTLEELGLQNVADELESAGKLGS